MIEPMHQLVPLKPSTAVGPTTGSFVVPTIIADAGEQAARRFLEFFAATIRNTNTRMAYYRAALQFFAWCDQHQLGQLVAIEPLHVAAYIEALQKRFARPSVKQHLAAIRMLFDWLVTGGIVATNPEHAVRGPTQVVKRGKTPVLTSAEARALLDSIDTSTVVGLRDRALLSVMVFTFARVGAVVAMRVEDYYPQGKRWWVRLHEKGGKRHEMPAHHTLEAYLDAYLDAAGIRDRGKSPLFRSAVWHSGTLTENAMHRIDAWRMIQRRAAALGLKVRITCHTFRATGITAYMDAGGTLEKAQRMAAHESPRTTKLYDRTGDAITLDEVERIRI
jgi:site-specific recombinase XerD